MSVEIFGKLNQVLDGIKGLVAQNEKLKDTLEEVGDLLAEARQVFRDHVAVTNFYCGVCDRHAPRDVDGVPEDIPHTDECTIGKIEGLLSRIRK